jgi:hypothetical protein
VAGQVRAETGLAEAQPAHQSDHLLLIPIGLRPASAAATTVKRAPAGSPWRKGLPSSGRSPERPRTAAQFRVVGS